MKHKNLVAGAVALALAALALVMFIRPARRPRFQTDSALTTRLNTILDRYRKIIVLVDGADALDGAQRARSISAGRLLFWDKQSAIDEVRRNLLEQYDKCAASGFRTGGDGVHQFVEFVSATPGLHDADRLAFLDLVEELEAAVPPGAGKRNPFAEPLRKLRDEVQGIQSTYREEVTRIFSQFATRGGTATREKWDAYVRSLRETLSRDQILAGMDVPGEEEPAAANRGGSSEIFGTDFPVKSVALTFDDGPHPRYTEQVLALLRKYGIRATFFELGVNLGTVTPEGVATLSKTGELAKKVLADGHVIANHTFSHRVLPKLAPAEWTSEIDRTELLLQAAAGAKPALFRAPYGARNQAILKQVSEEGLRSVMWTIDSLDWADPVPESIQLRVLHALNEKHKGIILFHDIHKQSVMALSPVIEELQRQEYSFLSFDGAQFTKQAPAPDVSTRSETAQTQSAVSAPGGDAKKSLYHESWAVVVGINDYQHWPKLRYAVNDANAIEDTLVTKFGFKRENIRKLVDGQATRERIMQVLGDELTDGRKVQREDRVFVFFAGHGATRTFEDGRQLGFIVPVDADQQNYYGTAISMSALREAADLIPAKHIYFVMDSCYSGLALSRGSGSFARDRSYLEEVTRRTARQILTAGGADQQVADDGPNGHSVFTWALLQGLQGQADLDGNGVITASELGAYISPIVSQFAKQTPTVGNLMGSEGGEFLFELQPEPLTSATRQLDSQELKLNNKLTELQQEIAARQAELLKLQQSIQAESAKLTQVKRPPQTVALTRGSKLRAYDLDRQGLELYREHQYAAAEQKFKTAVELKPNDPVLLNNLGFIYYVMGRYDDSLAYLQKTLAADPKRKEAHQNIADLLMKMGRRDEARQHYQQYLTLYPASPKAAEIRKLLQ